MGKCLLLLGLLMVLVTMNHAQAQCEEAWGYVEFIKSEFIASVTEIATSFKDATNTDLDQLVGDTMRKVKKIRESLLQRIKQLREGEMTTCPGQNIGQEQKLTEFQLKIMSILLKLVDADSPTVDRLKKIGNDLLRFKSSASQEVTRLLMLPENEVPVAPQVDCSDCDSPTESELSQCNAQCGSGNGSGSEGCRWDSCGARVINDTIAKMQDYKAYIGDENNEEQDKKEFVRAELINLINENNDDARTIFIKKANLVEEELDQCDQEELDVFSVIKGPMWQLANATIFSEIGEIEVMMEALIDHLGALHGLYCGHEPAQPAPSPDGPQCEWEEYQQSDLYLEKLDEIIQDSLFKATEDKDKIAAILGFVDIKKMFNQRVKKLFEEELRCPDEVPVIQKEFMGQLNTCMEEFLNPNVLFTEMSRQQRISCINILRNSIEDRSAKLLQYEVEKSLSIINESY